MLLGYTVNGRAHCLECSRDKLKAAKDDILNFRDKGFNEIRPIYCWDSLDDDCRCDGCGDSIYGQEGDYRTFLTIKAEGV